MNELCFGVVFVPQRLGQVTITPNEISNSKRSSAESLRVVEQRFNVVDPEI